MALMDFTILETGVLLTLITLYMYIAVNTIHANRNKKTFIWTKTESTAIVIRYLFFASLVSFIVYAAIMLTAVIAITVLNSTLHILILFPITIPILSLILLILTGLSYAVLKLKHLYELIDEEVYGFTP